MVDDGYVTKITVAGSGIEEYYEFENPVTEDEARQVWLDDVRDNRPMGERLARKYADKVEVTRIWETSQERPDREQVREVEGPKDRPSKKDGRHSE